MVYVHDLVLDHSTSKVLKAFIAVWWQQALHMSYFLPTFFLILPSPVDGFIWGKGQWLQTTWKRCHYEKTWQLGLGMGYRIFKEFCLLQHFVILLLWLDTGQILPISFMVTSLALGIYLTLTHEAFMCKSYGCTNSFCHNQNNTSMSLFSGLYCS